MDVDVLEEPELDTEEHGTKRPHKEPVGSLSKTRQQSGSSGTEPYGASYSGFPPVYPVFMSHNRWGERGGGEEDIQDNLLHSSCTAGGSIDQASPTSVIEYSVYLHDQHKIADCTRTRPVTPPVSPVTHRPCPFIPVPNSVTTIGTTVSPFVNPVISSTMTDTCSPFSSMSSTTGLAWDTLRSTSKSPGCSDRDPVSAAAHLHLLGESLSLIGRHLQETDKMVCMSSGLSLLLDSLLCALAPLICLTMQIPELRSCTQHTLASTLENIAYVMPGL
ncbi:uncharacterized protein LOC121180029 isoform X2 [Toxotes jaculatrix]|uniref:uncharacterized protein LOC121180029 isoform X2 n=1 Tax=Toxotes jaculatrix TaxID=941984 RepID=UPI001B3ACA6C|nr:uncharacterized protein LOC121180029 isoform X2 [Toxotes jaculatrix]